MMQSAEVTNLDDTATIQRMDIPVLGAIHLQGLMDPPAVIVAEEARQNPPQVPFVQHDHVVEAFSADAPDHPFDIGILPRTSWCADHLLDAHVRDATCEVCTVDLVSITKQEAWCLIPRECVGPENAIRCK